MVQLLHIYCVHFCARMLDHNPLRFLSQETFIGLQSLKYLWVKPFLYFLSYLWIKSHHGVCLCVCAQVHGGLLTAAASPSQLLSAHASPGLAVSLAVPVWWLMFTLTSCMFMTSLPVLLFFHFRDLEGNQIQTLNSSILKTCSKLEVL